MRELSLLDADQAPLRRLAHDAAQFEMATADTDRSALNVPLRHHDAGECLWRRGWLALHQQFDPRVSGVTTLLLQLGSIALLFGRSLVVSEQS